jgi:tungstate transport system substrate-binding protein
MPTRRSLVVLAATITLVAAAPARAQDRSIVVASTTSTQDSGLFGHILPLFKQKTGIVVKVVAQGTGKALDTARRGDADVVFVHAREAEEKFIAQGFGVKRHSVMYNDFVIIGPKDDPASIKGSRNAAFALQSIKAKGAPFISRGDRSAPISPNSTSGRRPASTSRRRLGRGTNRSGRAWVPRSTQQQPAEPT